MEHNRRVMLSKFESTKINGAFCKTKFNLSVKWYQVNLWSMNRGAKYSQFWSTSSVIIVTAYNLSFSTPLSFYVSKNIQEGKINKNVNSKKRKSERKRLTTQWKRKTVCVCTQRRRRGQEKVNSHHINRITVCARWTTNEEAKGLRCCSSSKSDASELQPPSWWRI